MAPHLSLPGASLLSLRGAQRRGNPDAGAYRHCATSSRLPRCARNDKPKHPPVIALPPVIESSEPTVIARSEPIVIARSAATWQSRCLCLRHCATSSRLPRCARNDKPRHPPSLRYPLSLRGAQRRGNPDASAYCCSPYQSCAKSRCSGFNPSISATFRARDHDFICFSREMASSTLTQSSK